MIDRHDIDALLIGALYGELTPADEARLTAHFESNPGDRSVLEALTQTRATVRASGLATFQLDPPQAISAILLQEAARRAPKVAARPVADDEPGWFARFVRSFMAHPAMAAAAMIVVVAGVGGLLYSRQGKDQFAEQRMEAAVAAKDTAPTPTMPPAAGSGSGAATAGEAAPAFEDSTARRDQGDAKGEGGKLGANQEAYRVDLVDGLAADKSDAKVGAATTAGVKAKAGEHAGIVVNPKRVAPKDLAEDDAPVEQQAAKRDREDKPAPAKKPSAPTTSLALDPASTTTEAPRGGAYAPGAGAGSGPPSTVNGPAPAPDAKAPAPKPAATDPSLLAWAKDQHQRAIALVGNNNCRDAAALAAQIAARANDYYNQYVANDRQLKACVAYINDARDKDAEKTNKARAQKRVDVNEAPAPTNMR